MPNKIHTLFLVLLISACDEPTSDQRKKGTADTIARDTVIHAATPGIYAPVRLTTDLSVLDEGTRQMIPLLIEAAKIMDTLFWYEAWGTPSDIPATVDTPEEQRYFQLNYGPWDRMDGNKPFVEGIGPKPPGARFYPEEMTEAEFEALDDTDKTDLYTFVRRDVNGQLYTEPYHRAFARQVQRTSDLLLEASELATDAGLKNYLTLRAEALLTDDYTKSDKAWLDMKDNTLDVIIGPIETYEDALFGYKAAHECYIAVKDMEWTRGLARFAKLLPDLQKGLPVPDRYKAGSPGSDSQLGAYDVIYYAGDCNSGGKTIAVNLPNDEQVQLEKGTRRLQFKNAMRAKYDKILLPISEVLIDPEQRGHITFDAFFENTMFHEVAHGLGIKNTITGKGTVREALLEQASALEEGKADILGLYMITELAGMGELDANKLKDNYVTFMASIFRSVRFGASSAHGKANMLRFNFFREKGAFKRDPGTGFYSIDMDGMKVAMVELNQVILTLQGDGDVEAVRKLMAEKGSIGNELQQDLDRVDQANIPVDVTFEQGAAVLGL